MPGSATVWLEEQVLAHTLAYGTMTRPTGMFVGLCAAAPPPSSSVGGVEVSGNGYARQSIAFALTAVGSNIAANTATVAFPAATAAWGAIGFFEIWDAVTAGNRYYQGPLVDPADGITPITRNILSGDIVRFQAGVLEVTAT